MLFEVVSTEKVDWDEYYGFVIRANSWQEARKMAHNASSGYQRERETFLRPETSKCTQLAVQGPSEIIRKDFKAG